MKSSASTECTKPGRHEDHFQVHSFDFGPWTLTVTKSHILPSLCQHAAICDSITDVSDSQLCSFCRYSRQLSLPSMPEMCFADNMLRIQHTAGHGIEFNALDALKRVQNTVDLVVACAQQWKSSRSDLPGIDTVTKPFDWTFTSDYQGTLVGKHLQMTPRPTELRIDMDKLKEREKIMFYHDIVLFEDELADNGCALCSVKVRVMSRSFFLLLRFYLRVDDVLVRVYDTRIYHEADQKYLLREFTCRESPIEALRVPVAVLTDPNQIWMHLPVVKATFEQLMFPAPP